MRILASGGFRTPFAVGSPGAQQIYAIYQNINNPFANINAIQLALALNTEVILGFNVTQEFQGAPGGYIPFDLSDLGTSVGGHVVHIVGFVSNADLAADAGTSGAPPGAGGGYFIIKNSWGAKPATLAITTCRSITC